jgi:hypothetical protein
MVEGETQTQELDMVQRATMEREKLEKVLNETKEVLAKNQATEARIILGGQSVAGQPMQKPEETPKE